MSTTTLADYPSTWRRPGLISNPLIHRGVTGLVVLYVLWSIGSLEIDWQRTAQGMDRAATLLGRMFPPDFSRWELLVKGIRESVQMALAASFFGMALAVPVGLCAARNLVPMPVYVAARGIVILTRTFHEVIIAIIFVKIFGFGPLAGILTLTVASLSFIAKMLAEDVENMSPGSMEAVRATGADFPKLLVFAVSPTILPRYLGVSIYRLDANIRHSTVVGIVGAGGIGQVLQASFNRYDYDFSLAILICIVALVFVGEFFSAWIRGRLR